MARKKSKENSGRTIKVVLLLLFSVLLITLAFKGFNFLTTRHISEQIINDLNKEKIIEEINKKREEKNIPKLKENKFLRYSATLKASDMAIRDYIGHTNPEGQAFQTLIKEIGYNCDGCYISWSENLGSDYYRVSDLIKAWTDSIPHSEILLDPEMDDIGIGIAYNKVGKSFIVMHLGIRK
jgi:uncharacterized protein YkwD